MKKSLLVLSLVAAFTSGAYAFGLPQVGGVGGGGSSASTVNAGQLIKDAAGAINQFLQAEVKIAKAMGVYNDFAANNQLIENLKQGDAAATKDDLEAKVKVTTELNEVISKKMAENSPLDKKQKGLALEGTMEYVKGVVASQKLVGSIQSASKNPVGINPTDLGSLTTLASNLPTLVKTGASSTGTIINYMKANGVDMSKVKAEADKMEK